MENVVNLPFTTVPKNATDQAGPDSAAPDHKLLLASLCCQIDCAREAWLRMIDELDNLPATDDLAERIERLGKQTSIYQELLFSIFRARRGIKPGDLR